MNSNDCAKDWKMSYVSEMIKSNIAIFSLWIGVALHYIFATMENNINVLFGRKVAKLRKLQGISQEELAERCGIHRTYIGAIERGEKSPTLNTIEKIANGLNVEIIELWEVKQID